MKKLILLFLALATLAVADDTATEDGAYNVRMTQRRGVTPWNRITINLDGGANTWEAMGFDGEGDLTTLTLWDMTPSTNKEALKVLRINAAGTALEWADSGSGSGTGNVEGPASSVDNSIAVYNGVSGEIIKDGGSTIAGVLASAASAAAVLYQPLDADLTAIAALTTTSFGRGLLDDAAASDARTTLGLTIGTDVQAYSAQTSLLGASIALSEMGTLAQSTIIGRYTASTGIPEAITVGGDFSLAGGTMSLANSYQTLDSDLTAIAALTTTSFGRGLLDDADAAAVRTSIEAGTTKSGTQAAPTTTNPLSPTWTTQDYILWYGATGQVNLPAASTYTNKTIRIYSTGTFTITVDPSGSEIIVESGVSLGAGVSDAIVGEAGLWTSYTCDGSRWVKQESGGAGTFTGTGTYAANFIYSGTMSADATLTLSPFVAGSTVEFDLDVTGATRTATFPSSLRAGYSSAAITTLALPVGRQRLSFYNNGTSIILLDSVPDDVILATDTSGAFVKSIEDSGSSEIIVTGSGNEDAEVTLELSAGIARVSGNIGAATATTPAAADDSTKVATTAWVQDELEGVGGGASIATNRQTVFMWEEFIGIATAATFGEFGLLRETTGGAVAAVTATNTDTSPGQINLYTGTGTTNKIGIMSNATPTGWILGGGTYVLEQRVYIETLAATTTNEYTFRSGFLDSIAAEPVDGVYFRYSQADANWITVCRSNSVETASAVTSTTAVVEDAWIKLRIEINAAATQALFYVNGTLIRTETANIPTGAARYTSIGTSAIKAAGSVDNDYFIDYYGLEIGLTSAR